MSSSSDVGGGTAPSLVDRVYQHTRQAILRGAYPPGRPLRAQELADEVGVSLIPVREALRLLAGERLVVTIPNKGARVAPLSLRDMRDSYRLRVILEGEALRQAYPRITAGLIEEGRTLADEMSRDLAGGNSQGGFEAHRRFHFLLYEASQSDWLLHFIEILWNSTERYWRLATPLHPPETVGGQHAQILDALEEGDLGAAIEALQYDLEHTVEVLVEVYQVHEAEAAEGG